MTANSTDPEHRSRVDVPASNVSEKKAIRILTDSGQEVEQVRQDSEQAAHPEYILLKTRYKALSDNFKKAKEALQKRRNERDHWHRRAVLLENKIRAAETEHGLRILGRDLDRPKEPSEEPGDHGRRPEQSEKSMPPENNVASENARSLSVSIDIPRAPTGYAGNQIASDSTQSEGDEIIEPCLPELPAIDDGITTRIKLEPSSDDAVFVVERSLKKRKFDGDKERMPTTKVAKIEPNNNSSSPVVSLQRCGFDPQESPDLGDGSPNLLTPRKHLELELLNGHTQRSNDGEEVLDPVSEMSSTTAEASGKASYTSSSVLTPINLKRQLPAKLVQDKLPAQPLRKGLSRGIAVLAEDGNIYQKTAQNSPTTLSAKTPAIKGRLDILLNTPSLKELVKVDRSARGQQTPATPILRDALALPKTRELPFDRDARILAERKDVSTPIVSRPPLADTTNTVLNHGAHSAPSKEGRRLLRSKHLSELRLDDFKINPKANSGQDFAFSEVVRKKDDRACLDGCVDMHCCGKQFRALALSQRPNWPLTPEQRREKQRLLEEYLGDYSYRLSTMNKEERAEIWLEAKTRELAKKYGTHRHRFSRMRSPPGFWDADFPNTQELDANRAEAAKREKQTVQDRYREAMRSGGRWIFKDE